jgi:tripartite-type tricarboxylate transporter receptor subunit TctC
MKFPRRQLLHLAVGAAALPAVSRIARAQAYPARPVRIIVGPAPGGAIDILARLIGQWLSEHLGQPVIVESKPGAGTNVGTEFVVRALPDGYTLLLVAPPSAINATLYEHLSFNFIRDIAPIAGIMRVPNIMSVNPSVPAKTVPEFIAFAKANPGKISMASGGNGTGRHGVGRLARRLRQAHRRRDREVGQGGEVRGHQAGLSRDTRPIFHSARSANRCSAARPGTGLGHVSLVSTRNVSFREPAKWR